MYVLHLFLLSVTFAFTAGFSTSPVKHTVSSSNALETGGISPEQTRVTFLTNVLLGTTALFSPLTVYAKTDDVTLPNGVVYTVVKQGSGPKPERGELVAIRFAAYNGDIQIDNIFDSPEPYYTRLGSGGLIQGVEETLPLMQLGDRWRLTIPGDLAFGKKGRPSSAGKPRIQGDAVIVFEVEMVGLPGKEPELIDIIGDV